eukprot:CAMPEP_0115005694 /NCGR_PEP_ID=MMETSP0216-20121206/20039_1 /TAXON_ID=223996 /ORGANISM="Protocruzia adherens, Strain Boccale" /LENGTH=94 /DNA_ID=CAMNT_0002372099 /DNA_START=332 /DNA_END=616 /DNA_ORIENTATION=+
MVEDSSTTENSVEMEDSKMLFDQTEGSESEDQLKMITENYKSGQVFEEFGMATDQSDDMFEDKVQNLQDEIKENGGVQVGDRMYPNPPHYMLTG